MRIVGTNDFLAFGGEGGRLRGLPRLAVVLLLAVPQPTGAEEARETVPTVMSTSIAKVLLRIEEDQTFEKLREERFKLLTEIPALRTTAQEFEVELSKLLERKTELEKRLSTSVEGVKSPELRQLESKRDSLALQIGHLETVIETVTGRIVRISDELDAAKRRLNANDVELAALRVKMEEDLVKLDDANSNLTRAGTVFDRKYAGQRHIVDAAEQKLEDIKGRKGLIVSDDELEKWKVSLSTAEEELRAAKEALSKVGLDDMSEEMLQARQAAKDASTQDKRNKENQDRLLTAQREAHETIQRLMRDLRSEEDAILNGNAEIEQVKLDLADVEANIALQIKRDKTRVGSSQDLRTQLDSVNKRVGEINEALDKAEVELKQKIVRQSALENEINTLLIPRTAENEFKLTVSLYFAGLVGLVIFLFFFIAIRDGAVRRMVFSAQAGIQFVTLFSLVIAIILFGITGILEGKELAALLGGISGYILGRVAPDSKLPANASGDGAGDGQVPTATPKPPPAPNSA